MVFRFSSSESQEMGLSVFVFGKSGNGLPVFSAYSTWKNEMVPDVRMMETTGSGRLDNGNRNEPECRMKLRPGLW
ncbi:unnamed protein product [Rhizophagus irregularis]|nr:unnamed protein product [Rhizophagus irregularis]